MTSPGGLPAVPAPIETLSVANALSDSLRLATEHLGAAFVIVLVLSFPCAALTSTVPPTKLFGVLSVFVTVFAAPAVFVHVHEHERGRQRGILSALGAAFGAWRAVLGVSISRTVLSLLWALLLIVPGIVKAVAYSIAIPLRLFEPSVAHDWRTALASSEALLAGHKATVFVALSAIAIVPLVGFGVNYGMEAAAASTSGTPLLAFAFRWFGQLAVGFSAIPDVFLTYAVYRRLRVAATKQVDLVAVFQ